MADGGFAAEILKRSAGGYAGAAASLLLEARPELKAQAGALDAWKGHLTQRVVELSAALSVNEPVLFSERVRWSRKTFAARNQDEQMIAASLGCLRDVLQESLPAQAKVAVDYMSQALDQLGEPAPDEDPCELNPDDPAGSLALRYLQSALEGDSYAASQQVLDAVSDEFDAKALMLDVLLPAQKEIGRLWHTNEVSVAEEHMVSATTRRTMSLLTHQTKAAPAKGATVISACVPGNIHDIALRALADIFQLEGWRSLFVGADTPVDDLASLIASLDADVLLLGGTLSTQISGSREAIKAVRHQCGDKVRIMLGGAAFDEVPEIWRELGADAYAANADEALRIALQLIKK
ncbi:MAG: cobalamin B12-binding domain-containing protein [Gammaproteobacteria bacterium]